jgi:CHAD domain-containing protein
MFDCQGLDWGPSFVADERICEWADGLARADVLAFKRARQRYLKHPTENRLHDLRIAARRLRSLFDDVRDAIDLPQAKQVHRLIALLGEARDAAVLRTTLTSALDVREREAVRPLLRDLRHRERKGNTRVLHALERIELKGDPT